MVLAKSKRVKFLTVRQKDIPFVLELEYIAFLDFLFFLQTLVAKRIVTGLGRVVVLEVNHQDVRVCLLISIDDLSEVNWACDGYCPLMIEAHSVDIAITANPQHVLRSRLICKEAHSLIPSMSEGGL